MGSTAGGKVYVWGCNASGRLGLGHDRNELAPVLVARSRSECGWDVGLFL